MFIQILIKTDNSMETISLARRRGFTEIRV